MSGLTEREGARRSYLWLSESDSCRNLHRSPDRRVSRSREYRLERNYRKVLPSDFGSVKTVNNAFRHEGEKEQALDCIRVSYYPVESFFWASLLRCLSFSNQVETVRFSSLKRGLPYHSNSSDGVRIVSRLSSGSLIVANTPQGDASGSTTISTPTSLRVLQTSWRSSA